MRKQRFLSLLNRAPLLVDIILLYGEPLNCRRNKLCSLDVGDGRHSVGLVSTHQPCATLLVILSDIFKTYLVASTPSLVGFLTYRRVERIPFSAFNDSVILSRLLESSLNGLSEIDLR